MKQDHSSLEAELRSLQAAMLDDELLQRLEAAADGTQTQLTREEIRFEEFLRQTSPARLSPDFLAELETVVRDVPFPVNEKILLFPKGQHGRQAPTARGNRPMWAAAAAVAVIGALSALMIPAGKPPVSGDVARQDTPPVSALLAAKTDTGNLIPASFNRGVSEVSDAGIVWKSNNQPHSLVRVVYQDRITLKDKDGRTYQVEQPKVKYMLVPAKAD
jgi:hypothetical protein